MTLLQTFRVPELVTGTGYDSRLGRAMIRAWRVDGVFQIVLPAGRQTAVRDALAAGRRFFALPESVKNRCVSDLSYSGYAAATTAAEALPESFTVCKDVPLDDARVLARWPCHGPVPWPADPEHRRAVNACLAVLGSLGDRLLKLAALGLGTADGEELTSCTFDGWHHARLVRHPPAGTGARTGHGLLMLTAQQRPGGLAVRPPVRGEKRYRNWLAEESTTGMYEDEPPWTEVDPEPGPGPRTLTVLPGDLMQYLTHGTLPATPYRMLPRAAGRIVLDYFHEPNFAACLRPLGTAAATATGGAASPPFLHYGSHFTHLFARRHPDRGTTRRIIAEERLAVLDDLRYTAGRPAFEVC
ncbi:2-oxoglutarate and iron-dependent oxygenase domain-containing protein [Streptomyces aidingensis]|uniref:Isopenicillin N synthase n=1 Tax=Streptomyces aidingensis TaxID=910347 RepID=A0A1I1HS96_9ACTN|nr:2-oxoglutarate and iron-dependent oxygenase domain-containing protein [Streptomyces aidingensis]SFC26685.1 Isopenicillin N synthase [Streptomyces aidingensis]